MQVQQLIKLLQEQQESHGDVEVNISYDGGHMVTDVSDIYIDGGCIVIEAEG